MNNRRRKFLKSFTGVSVMLIAWSSSNILKPGSFGLTNRTSFTNDGEFIMVNNWILKIEDTPELLGENKHDI